MNEQILSDFSKQVVSYLVFIQDYFDVSNKILVILLQEYIKKLKQEDKDKCYQCICPRCIGCEIECVDCIDGFKECTEYTQKLK